MTEELLRSALPGAEQREIARSLKLRSFIVVPMRTAGSVTGALTLLTAQGSDRALGPAEVDLTLELARRCGSAVERGRLFERAREAIALRDEFLSVAAHELRTPLYALYLKLELLEELDAPPAIHQVVQRVQSSARALQTLVDSLLDVSRMTEGRLSLSVECTDLAAMTAEVIGRLSEQASRAGCEITLHAPEPVVGRFDRARMEQVVSNLVANAITHAAPGPIAVRVDADATSAYIRVEDRGPGLPPADLERVFGRFERASSARHHGGLGLGLYISTQIVQAHGGTIRAENRPDGGAVFTVRVPRGGDLVDEPA